MTKPVNDFLERPKASRLIGIDYGMVRLGVAISDERKVVATPLKIITAGKKLEITAEKVINELTEHQRIYHYVLEKIVMGLPLMMSGKKGLIADEVLSFVTLLQKLTEVPIVTWDERLTSVQAERSMREGSMTRKKRAQFVDTVAAVIILQNYLDRCNCS